MRIRFVAPSDLFHRGHFYSSPFLSIRCRWFHGVFFSLRQIGQASSHFQTGQPQASKNGARFFCTFSENFLTHRFILPGLSLGMSERVWYSAKSWVNGSHPKASWSWKRKKGQNEVQVCERLQHTCSRAYLISYDFCVCVKSLQLCPPPCHPMDCSPPASPVHGIFQARILEWVAISFSRGSSWTQGSDSHLLHLSHWQWVLYHQRHPVSRSYFWS